MILTPHILIGAAIGAQTSNVWVAFLLGLISHYLVDAFPHWEYLAEVNISDLNSIKKILLDLVIGIILVLVLVWSNPNIVIILMAVIGSILPDFLHGIYSSFKIKWLKPHFLMHHKIHAFKTLSFWKGMPIAIIVSLAAIWVLIL